MKFWELVSVCRSHPQVLKQSLQAQGETQLLQWVEQFDELVAQQQRSILDSQVAADVCRNVLTELPFQLHQGERYLWSVAREETAPIALVDVFDRYGGSIIEDVLEKGRATTC